MKTHDTPVAACMASYLGLAARALWTGRVYSEARVTLAAAQREALSLWRLEISNGMKSYGALPMPEFGMGDTKDIEGTIKGYRIDGDKRTKDGLVLKYQYLTKLYV